MNDIELIPLGKLRLWAPACASDQDPCRSAQRWCALRRHIGRRWLWLDRPVLAGTDRARSDLGSGHTLQAEGLSGRCCHDLPRHCAVSRLQEVARLDPGEAAGQHAAAELWA